MDLLTNDDLGVPSWGAWINTSRREPRREEAPPEGRPAWAKPYDVWHFKRYGLVVWDNNLQRVEVLSFIDAIKLLEQLRSNDAWKSKGIPITRKTSYFKQPQQPSARRSRKKSAQPTPETPTEKPEMVTVDEERIRLRDQAAIDFYALLAANEAQMRQLAEEDERQMREALSRAYGLILGWSHEKESKELDTTTRLLPWHYDEQARTWTCDLPPNRGTVKLTKSNFFWEGCVEQPNRFKLSSPLYFELEKALSWAEQKLTTIEQDVSKEAGSEADKLPRLSMATITPEKRAQLAPFWIEPTALEPERITYRVIICLEYKPLRFKTMEMSFGKLWQYDEEYATPTVLARELRLDQTQLDIHQTISLYTITSHAMYFQESLTAAQAQQLWDRSLIVAQHQAKKVIWAQYGFQEVETGYTTWLGGCADPSRPWPKEPNRAEHLADCALQETLVYALDLEGYRSYLGMSPKYFSDEKLLALLHKARAKSTHIPSAALGESEQWLREHTENNNRN